MAAIPRESAEQRTLADSWTFVMPPIIMRWPGLSTEAKLTWCWLRSQAEASAGSIAVNFAEVAAVIGRTESRARSWIKQLVDVGLVERCDVKRGPGGSVQLYLVDPQTFAHLRRLDPPDADQPLLFKGVGCAPKASDTIAHPTVFNPDDSENKSAADSRERSNFDADQQNGTPSASMETIESKILNPIDHRTSQSMVSMGQRKASVAPSDPPPLHESLAKRDAAAMAQIDQRIAEAQAEYQTEPEAMPNVVARAIDRFGDRSKHGFQRDQIKAEILRLVGDPNFHESIAGRVADAVLGGQLTDGAHRKILDDLAQKKREGSIHTSAGGYYLTRVRKLVPALRKTKGKRP
jgi:hypothetical protein